jgi:hypothetical protein
MLTSVDFTDQSFNPLRTVDVLGRIVPLVVIMADATSFTPTDDVADVCIQTNTQASGTLTVNSPSGSPNDGQVLWLRIKCTNTQTFAWGAAYRGSTTNPLPETTSGSSKTDYFEFIYNATDSKWDFQSVNYGA